MTAFSNLQKMKRVVGVLQVLQLTSSPLQFIDFLPKLLDKLLLSLLSRFPLLHDLLDERSLVFLDDAYHRSDGLNACFYHSFFIHLQVCINQC